MPNAARAGIRRIRDATDLSANLGDSEFFGYALVWDGSNFVLGDFDAAGAAAVAMSNHLIAADPHSQYLLEAAIGSIGAQLIAATTAAEGRTALGLGTAAVLNVGTSANNVVQLDESARLPAVSGALLTNLPVAGSTTQVIYNNAGSYAGDAGMVYDAASDRLTVVGGLVAGDWSPPSDSTTALSIWNAARSTRVVTVDTTNGKVGIGTTPSAWLTVRDTQAYTGSSNSFSVVQPNSDTGLNAGIVFAVRSDSSVKLTDRYGDTLANVGLHVNYRYKTINAYFGRDYSNLATTGLAVSSNFSGTHNFSGSIVSGITTGMVNTNATQRTGLCVVSSYDTNNYVAATTAVTYGVYSISNNTSNVLTNGASKRWMGGYFSAEPSFATDNASSISIGIQASATGAQFNYAALFPNGYVGVGMTTPTALLDIAASTTARASLRIREAAAVPSAPNSGDFWFPTSGRLTFRRASTTEIVATGVTGSGAAATAGATYTSAEQTMLQAIYNAGRAFGLIA